jgi:transcriptional regulator with XRE-family HTH domain
MKYNEFEEAKRILADLQRAEEEAKQAEAILCDWDNPEDVAVHRRMRNDKRRLVAIQRHTDNMMCPRCRKVVADPARWVVKGRKTSCRSCYQRKEESVPEDIHRVDEPMFLKPELRFTLNPVALKIKREELGISMNSLADACLWSRSRQRSMEGGRVHSVTSEMAERIKNVIPDPRGEVFSAPEFRFTIDPFVLIEARELAELSQQEFARKAGWSRSRQRQLEGGEVQSCSQEVAETIVQVLIENGVEVCDELPETNL